MKNVVDNGEVEDKVGKHFIKSLTKHFNVACKINKQGTLVCDFTAKSLFRKPRTVIIRVPSEVVDNHGYVEAVVDTGVRKLINGVYDRS